MQLGGALAGNIGVIEQGLELLRHLDDREYEGREADPLVQGVASHFRHCVDFYESFFGGLDSGEIDYDRRERDPRVERDRRVALDRFERIHTRLRSLSCRDGETRLFVRAEEYRDPEAAPARSVSSLRRELQFLLSHTIHHYALIALKLRLQGIDPGKEFGVAPSTLAYWRRAGKRATESPARV
jgi:DinB superfamily